MKERSIILSVKQMIQLRKIKRELHYERMSDVIAYLLILYDELDNRRFAFDSSDRLVEVRANNE